MKRGANFRFNPDIPLLALARVESCSRPNWLCHAQPQSSRCASGRSNDSSLYCLCAHLELRCIRSGESICLPNKPASRTKSSSRSDWRRERSLSHCPGTTGGANYFGLGKWGHVAKSQSHGTSVSGTALSVLSGNDQTRAAPAPPLHQRNRSASRF